MCIIINRDGRGLLQYRTKQSRNQKHCTVMRHQSGFTLPEMLVSLCILGFIMHGVWQIYAGLSPICPEGWDIYVASIRDTGLLYETTVQIRANHRQWQFYYAGPEEIVYADSKNSSQ